MKVKNNVPIAGLFLLLSLISACGTSPAMYKAKLSQTNQIAVISGEDADGYLGLFRPSGTPIWVKGRQKFSGKFDDKGKPLYEEIVRSESAQAPFPDSYLQIFIDITQHLNQQYPDKQFDFVSRSTLPQKNGKIDWNQTPYSIVYILDLAVKYETNGKAPFTYSLDSGLSLDLKAKASNGKYNSIKLTPLGGLAYYSLATTNIEDSTRQSYDNEMSLEALMSYPPLHPDKIIQPSIEKAKAGLDKLKLEIEQQE